MTAAEQTAAIKAAMSVGRDLAEGRLAPDALTEAAVAECRALVGQVIGPHDALWALQLEVCRGVLAVGGVPVDELAEWLAVAKAAENAADVIPNAAADVDSDGPAATESDEQASGDHPATPGGAGGI